MSREKIVSRKLDANETIFFARELEYVKAKVYEKKYAELKAKSLLPVSTDAGPAAETITYTQYDQHGVAKIIANYADDLPRVDVSGEQKTSNVRGIGDSYGFNIQEIRAANATGKNLSARKANAARRGIEQVENSIAWYGDTAYGLVGLFYNANVTKGAAVTGDWATATNLEILGDMMAAVDNMIDITNGMEVPNQILLPIAQYSKISSSPMQAGSDTTVLDFFKKNRPGIEVDWLVNCKDVSPVPSTGAAGPTDIMVVYKRDIDNLSLEIPQPFEQFPAQERGLEQVVDCHARNGGVIVYYPLSVSIVEGI